MKAAQFVLLLIFVIVLMDWSRGDHSFALPMTLPLLGGKEPAFYDIGAAAALLIALIGLIRLRRGRDHDSQ